MFVLLSTLIDLWETVQVISLVQQQQSTISLFNTSLFKHSASWSQRLRKGHLVGRMKTWQPLEQRGLALFSYQRDPQAERLNLDFVWKSVSIADFWSKIKRAWLLIFSHILHSQTCHSLNWCFKHSVMQKNCEPCGSEDKRIIKHRTIFGDRLTNLGLRCKCFILTITQQNWAMLALLWLKSSVFRR